MNADLLIIVSVKNNVLLTAMREAGIESAAALSRTSGVSLHRVHDYGRAWQRWAEGAGCDAEGRLDLYGLQALVMRAVVESGECFVRFLMVEPSPANPIGLRLQVLEADHLDTARNGMVAGAATIQGIALGEAGEPIGYWLHRVHPGAAWILPGVTWLSSERISATEVLHIYRKRRPGQLRDVSWLAPVLLRLRDLGDYEGALLMKAKIEACLAAVVTEEGEEALTGAAAAGLQRIGKKSSRVCSVSCNGLPSASWSESSARAHDAGSNRRRYRTDCIGF